jgi:hypothetical protein
MNKILASIIFMIKTTLPVILLVLGFLGMRLVAKTFSDKLEQNLIKEHFKELEHQHNRLSDIITTKNKKQFDPSKQAPKYI